MTSRLVKAALVAALPMLGAVTASAHLGYGGRDFGTFSGGEAPVTITNQSVGGPFGWADGTDADFGDSHRMRAFRFTLAHDTTVTVSVQAIAFGTSIAGLLPGFSIYSGLAHLPPAEADRDDSPISISYLASLPGPAKEGAFRALNDWKIGSDENFSFADLSTLLFAGYAVDGTAANFGSEPGIVGDGLADGFITGTFALPAGAYSVFVGGADYASGIGAVAPFTNYGITTTVAPVPEPTAAAMLAGGVFFLFGNVRRRAV